MTDRRQGYSEQNKQAWDSLYGETEGEVWGKNPIPFVREFIDGPGIALEDGSNLLDAAAGEGRHLPLLLKLPGRVHATDASSNALSKMAAVVPGEYEQVLCDLERMPFEDGFFDLALLIDTVETLPNVDEVLGEICRVLKPGGRLLCNIPGKEDGISSEDMEETVSTGSEPSYLYQGVYYYRFYTQSEALELVRRNGFEVVRNEVRTWTEDAHPAFRDHEHSHTSRIFLLEKGLPKA